jgi:hypothetical protein
VDEFREQLVARFAVGIEDGPRSAVWRLWTQKGKSDVYNIAARAQGGHFKVSLHESGEWRFAFTKEHWKGRASTGGEDRVIERWRRPPSVEGVTRAFTVIVPSGEIGLPRHPLTGKAKKYTKNVTWVPPASEGFATHFVVMYIDPGGPELDEQARLRLPNGQSICLQVREHPISEAEKRQLRDGQLSIAEKVRQEPEAVRAAVDTWLEPRAWLYGHNEVNGARFFVDISAGYLFA